eukprot:3183033-Rhodomonas_salina.2
MLAVLREDHAASGRDKRSHSALAIIGQHFLSTNDQVWCLIRLGCGKPLPQIVLSRPGAQRSSCGCQVLPHELRVVHVLALDAWTGLEMQVDQVQQPWLCPA